MPKLGLSLGLPTTKISAEQVIWKVAIFGAGTNTSNGEYVWDGVSTVNGQRVYVYAPSYTSSINFNGSVWILEDGGFEDNTYYSLDLITWSVLNGASPAPSSALSYSQDSFISSITLTGSNPSYDADGLYTRASGGTTSFIGSGSKIIEYDGSVWFTELINYGGLNGDFFNWEVYGGADPVPVTTNAVYSA